MAEAQRMEIGVLQEGGQLRSNFHVVGDVTRQPFLHGYN